MSPRRYFTVIALGLAACGGDARSSDPAPEGPPPAAASSTAPDFDACGILRGMDLSPYLGAPAVEFKESIRTSAGSASAAMCGASPVGGLPLLTLMLRYSENAIPATSIESWIGAEFGEDSADYGPEMMADFRRAEVLSGLGDFAVAYNLAGPRLSAYWKTRYHVTVSANGFGDKALARQAVEAVAREAIAKF